MNIQKPYKRRLEGNGRSLVPAMLLIVAVLLGGCTQEGQQVDQKTASQAKSDSLVNGIYLVQRWTIDREDLFPLFDGEHFVEYDESKFFELKDEEDEPVKFVALSKTEFIPFDLAHTPRAIPQDDGRHNVGLTFSADMSQKMKTFSRQYLGRQVAMVVDGKIITLHKVRSIIDGGQVQISRCTDRGCELILGELKDQN